MKTKCLAVFLCKNGSRGSFNQTLMCRCDDQAARFHGGAGREACPGETQHFHEAGG